MPPSLLQTLCRANKALLGQKLALMDAILAKHGTAEAPAVYRKICPIVGASIGQHFRHSMDHVELAVLVGSEMASPSSSEQQSKPPEIHYDLRVRGGTLEHDMHEARKRIVSVADVLDGLAKFTKNDPRDDISQSPVVAAFFLTADEESESRLPSTVARELGFAAHHAIHHMAMVKIIATHTAGLAEEDLPDYFGRAPSTIKHDSFQPRDVGGKSKY